MGVASRPRNRASEPFHSRERWRNDLDLPLPPEPASKTTQQSCHKCSTALITKSFSALLISRFPPLAHKFMPLSLLVLRPSTRVFAPPRTRWGIFRNPPFREKALLLLSLVPTPNPSGKQIPLFGIAFGPAEEEASCVRRTNPLKRQFPGARPQIASLLRARFCRCIGNKEPGFLCGPPHLKTRMHSRVVVVE